MDDEDGFIKIVGTMHCRGERVETELQSELTTLRSENIRLRALIEDHLPLNCGEIVRAECLGCIDYALCAALEPGEK